MRRRSHNPTSAPVASGFTLVELLVVMFIIGALIAMLIPALSSARRQAQSIVCMSNLKNLTFDFRTVLDDPSDLKRWKNHPQDPKRFGLTSYLDRVYEAGAYYPNESEVTGHVRGDRLFFCPAAPSTLEVHRGTAFPEDAAPVLHNAVKPLAAVSYGFNARLYRVSRGSNPNVEGDRLWYTVLGPSLLTSAYAGRTVLVADYDGRAASDAGTLLPHLLAPAVEPLGLYVASAGSPHGNQWFPSYRHNRRCNLALIDGSVFTGEERDILHGSSSSVNWADAQYQGYWIDGSFNGTGKLAVSTLYSTEELSLDVVY